MIVGGVILHMRADRLVGLDDLDAVLLEQRRRPDAGDLQQLRRVDGAARHDHLALGAQELRLATLADIDADRAPALEDDARDERLRLDEQVLPSHRRPEIGARRRASEPARVVRW